MPRLLGMLRVTFKRITNYGTTIMATSTHITGWLLWLRPLDSCLSCFSQDDIWLCVCVRECVRLRQCVEIVSKSWRLTLSPFASSSMWEWERGREHLCVRAWYDNSCITTHICARACQHVCVCGYACVSISMMCICMVCSKHDTTTLGKKEQRQRLSSRRQ